MNTNSFQLRHIGPNQNEQEKEEEKFVEEKIYAAEDLSGFRKQ